MSENVTYVNPLGKWVAQQRERRKLSRKAFAERAAIGQWTAKRLEDGIGRANFQTLVAVFRVLGNPPRRVLRGLPPDERARVIAAARMARREEV